MLSTTIALLLSATAPQAAPAPARSIGPITATYHADRAVLCLRSGWNSASFAINRRVRAGECRSADEWRRQGLLFDTRAVLQARRAPTANAQVATR